MSSSLRLGYERVQDRIALSISGEGDQKYRIWLTRRLISELWPALVKALPAASRARLQAKGTWANEVLAFEREIALERARLGSSAEGKRTGEDPDSGKRPVDLLARQIVLTIEPTHTIRIKIVTADRRRLKLGLDLDNLHLFCEVLRKGVERAGWALELRLPWDTPASTPPMAHA